MSIMNMMRHNLLIRIVVAMIVVASLALFHREFYLQFNCYFKGAAVTIRGEWHMVALNIGLFVLLVVPLAFRRRAKWGEYGMVTAFFVSLFVEMYGFPFTLYMATRYFSGRVECAMDVWEFTFWGVNFGMELAMIYTSALIFLGTLLIVAGWATLYGHREDKFVILGLYRFSRHPQYLGFILVIIGWLIDWPTLITIIFVPILIYKYIQAARAEEREILARAPEYEKYQRRVPFLI